MSSRRGAIPHKLWKFPEQVSIWAQQLQDVQLKKEYAERDQMMMQKRYEQLVGSSSTKSNQRAPPQSLGSPFETIKQTAFSQRNEGFGRDDRSNMMSQGQGLTLASFDKAALKIADEKQTCDSSVAGSGALNAMQRTSKFGASPILQISSNMNSGALNENIIQGDPTLSGGSTRSPFFPPGK